ncbi:MAG: CoA-binding protein, partial [Planctomycetes bacterium]|nr:CoA-binding protein [Planctomycetota bacterium]
MPTRIAPTAGTLDPIFFPRSVAVVGASRQKDSLGYALLHNLLVNEFDGTIFPVNPKADVIHSLRCYPRVSDIPDPVDLAIILVPRAIVLPVIEECLEHGARGLVVITAGFREVGPEGAAQEQQVLARVRQAGARMIGPNCMGVINADPSVRLNATFAPTPARPGSVGFVSQSGALGVAILNVAAGLGIGFTQFVSMGNKADVSGNDLLQYWEEDEATRVVAMYLESFGNPRRFTQIAKRVSRKKPILVVKSGRTEAGARAASSHTGALAGADVTVSAFLEQCGVIRANTIEEMFAIAQALDKCPPPQGSRIAIVTNAGGPAIMATDACVNLGLEIAELGGATVESLRGFLPETASVANPVDMIAAAGVAEYASAVKTILQDPGVDVALAIHVMPLTSTPMEILSAITAAAKETPEKPVVVVMMATEDAYAKIRDRSDLVPIYEFPETAALALSKLAHYAAWRKRDTTPASTYKTDDAQVRQLLDRHLASTQAGSGADSREGQSSPTGKHEPVEPSYLAPDLAFGVLEAYGIPTAPWRLVATASEALDA